MKAVSLKLLAVLLILASALAALAGCTPPAPETPEFVDYVSDIKLDMSSSTKKQEVTLKQHIDGDTTHFYAPSDVAEEGVMKARYLAVNTPESTGSIEEWGKAASRFTKEKITTAVSIIVESNTDEWTFDGNGRHLVWVWYKPAEDADYRNLNLEILQNGLGVGSSTDEALYGETAVAAIAQAKREKLYVFSEDIDPDFPYGAAIALDLKELRTNIEKYDGQKVAFEGIVSYNSDWTAFVESYDPETDMSYGIQVFYGYNSSLISVLAQGNKVRIVGSVSEFSGTYQVSGLEYQPMRPNKPDNTAKISTGNEVPFTEVSPETFTGTKDVLMSDDTTKTFDYEELAVSTSISMKNLVVKEMHTTKNGSNKGAITLTCKVGNVTIDVRTATKLTNEKGEDITEAYFAGQTIDVRGVVDYFDYNNTGNGTYQIKVYTLDEIVRHCDIVDEPAEPETPDQPNPDQPNPDVPAEGETPSDSDEVELPKDYVR